MNSFSNSRRDFMKAVGLGSAAMSVHGCSIKNVFTKQKPAQTIIPRWRGFNIDVFSPWRDDAAESMNFVEQDFKWISELGFDFVRLPISYTNWIEKGGKKNRDKTTVAEVYNIRESGLETLDTVVEMANKYGIHLNLNLYRAPGYCVWGVIEEPFDLWKDQEALDAFCFHWEILAKRYQGISNSRISFNFVNEPRQPNDEMTRDEHARVITAAAKAIRSVDPDRLLIADGLSYGNLTLPELIPLGISQSVHGYTPGEISHYKASQATADKDIPVPVWPGVIDAKGETWNRKRLEKHYAPWIDLARKGIGVHAGECGAYNKTPHNVFLAWFRDVLEILTENNIGYAVWRFRGDFGVIDSERADVKYEDWNGHKLDRKMLELLKEF